VKLPEIPLPEPAFMITLPPGAGRLYDAEASFLQFALWMIPSAAVDYGLAAADGGRHSLWLTLAAAFLVLVIMMLTVGVEKAGTEEGP
jgi:hypothetical protein